MRRFVINSLISYFTELEKKMKSTVVTSAIGVFFICSWCLCLPPFLACGLFVHPYHLDEYISSFSGFVVIISL